MTKALISVLLILGLGLASCEATTPPPPLPSLNIATLDAKMKPTVGQTVYVPIYSYIYMWDRNRRMDLTATLSIRNTDRQHPIILISVDYYNVSGKLVRRYLDNPVELDPLAATEFVVNQEDTSGGSSAAFIVRWVATNPVTDPVIESIMINTSGNQGVSFVSTGRVIKPTPDPIPGTP